MKKILLLLVTLLVISGCGLSSQQTVSSDTLPVAVSLYPHQFLAQSIGKEHVAVTMIVSPGIEPHEFEPTPSDVATVLASRVFIYHGAGLDPWADRILVDASSTLVTLKVSDGLTRKMSETENNQSNQRISESSQQDPHIWLDPLLMMKTAVKIKDTFIKQDPSHAADYTQNFNELSDKLNALDNEYKTTLSHCQNDTVVSAHDAFNYLAQRYHFKVAPISGLSPHDEPSINDIKRLTDLLRAKKLGYVLTESLASARFSETLASEVGAKTLVLNPIEGLTPAQSEQGDDYLSLMHANLVTLKTALSCN